MLRLIISIFAGLLGVLALWPSVAIIIWAMLNGGFRGPLQGIQIAAFCGPVGGALVVGSLWSLTSYARRGR